MAQVEIKIPDIGDFDGVEVIEVLVAEGDAIEPEQSLVTLESDKASMEVPAEHGGKIASLTVSVGDKVSEGDVIGTLETAADAGSSDGAAQSDGADAAANGGEGDGGGTASGGGAKDGGGSRGESSGGGERAARGDGAGGGSASGGGTIDVAVPDIGDASGVEVIEVLVSVGDEVEVEQSLVTLESDKASMEVPSPAAGTVERIDVAVGDSVDEGSPLVVLSSDGGEGSGGGSSDGAADGGSAARRETGDGAGSDAAGDGGGPSQTRADTKPSTAGGAPAEEGAAARADGARAGGARTSPTAHISDEAMRRAHASPGVRRYAREHGADLSLIEGTGPKGRILKEDVIAFIKRAMEGMGSSYGGGAKAAGAPEGGMGIPPIPEVDFSKFGETERVELGRINKLSAKNLHRAWLNVPMVTHHDVADVTEMEAFRKELKATAKEGDPKVTGLAFHMKALVTTLKGFPKFNASLAPDGESLIMKKYFHVGIAVDTPNGLVVPVFRDVDRKSINELADEMGDVSSRARAKKLKPDEMQGASMTISSLGGIGGTAFTPIVNAPEVAILGITRASMQPVWDGEAFVPRLMCPLDLTYDHRVIDGADAARFMASYVTTIGDIRRLLL